LAKLRITLVKSGNGYSPDQIATLKTLGLRRMNMSVVREDSLCLRGQVMKVKHLLMVKEADTVLFQAEVLKVRNPDQVFSYNAVLKADSFLLLKDCPESAVFIICSE
jgi:large subunit ribosomal protein L30